MALEHKKIKPSATVLKNELRGIKSFDLLFKAANVFEKLFWGIVFILGMAWATYFLSSELESWQEIPSIIRYQQLKLSEIQSPAITFCPHGSTKFAIAERLGNYLNSESSLPDQLLEVRKMMLKQILGTFLPILNVPIKDVPPSCFPLSCKVINMNLNQQ